MFLSIMILLFLFYSFWNNCFLELLLGVIGVLFEFLILSGSFFFDFLLFMVLVFFFFVGCLVMLVVFDGVLVWGVLGLDLGFLVVVLMVGFCGFFIGLEISGFMFGLIGLMWDFGLDLDFLFFFLDEDEGYKGLDMGCVWGFLGVGVVVSVCLGLEFELEDLIFLDEILLLLLLLFDFDFDLMGFLGLWFLVIF